MEWRKVAAVREFNEHGVRWYPQVMSTRGLNTELPCYVRPQAWIDKNCPQGFDTPQAAILAAKWFTGEEISPYDGL